jgi:hypothetical protein
MQNRIDHRLAHGHGTPLRVSSSIPACAACLVGHLLGLVHAVQRGFHAIRNALWRGHQFARFAEIVSAFSAASDRMGKNAAVCLFAAQVVNGGAAGAGNEIKRATQSGSAGTVKDDDARLFRARVMAYR